jgi:hypothetical protein
VAPPQRWRAGDKRGSRLALAQAAFSTLPGALSKTDPVHFLEIGISRQLIVEPGSPRYSLLMASRPPGPVDDANTAPFVRLWESPAREAGWRLLRTTLLCDGLPNDELWRALSTRELEVRRFDTGMLIPLAGGIGIVRAGRAALGRFDRQVLTEERRAAAFGEPRRTHAGARAESILALLDEGELAAPAIGGELAAFAATPMVMLILSGRTAAEWSRRHPFFADRVARGLAATAAKLAASDEDRAWIGERARHAAAEGFDRAVDFSRRDPPPRPTIWGLFSRFLRR